MPLAAGCIYALGAMALKRCLVLGVGAWRTTFVSNWMLGLVWISLSLGGEKAWNAEVWIPGLVLALTFLGGQIFTFLSLERGDVSVATPALGSKVVWVALLSGWVLGEWPNLWVWVAAFVTAGGIVLLQAGPVNHRAALGWSLAMGSVSAIFFALTDVLVQQWAGAIGFMDLMPVMGLGLVVFSSGLIPFFHGPLREVRGKAQFWAGLGGGLIAVQASFMSIALGVFGAATSVNVVYSTRAVWSVLFIWVLGHWFDNREREAGAGVMLRRLAGSILILVSVAIVMGAG